MMKKITMSVYAACAILVIAGSLLWFVFTLYSDAAAGKTAALNNFKAFAQHTGAIVSVSAQEPDSARLHPQFEQLCRNYQKYVHAVVIKVPTGIVFTWPKNTDIFSYTEQSTVEVKNLPLFFTAAQTHIPIKETGATVTVYAALRTLPIETVFNRGRVVFFLLLLIVLMTVIVLVFSYMNAKPAAENPAFTSRNRMQETDTADSNGIQPDITQLDEYSAAAASQHDKDTIRQQTLSQPDIDPAHRQNHSNTNGNPASIHEETAAEERTAKTNISKTPLPLHEQLESLNRLHIYDDEPYRQTQPESQKNSFGVPADNKQAEHRNDVYADTPVSEKTAVQDISKTEDGSKRSNDSVNFDAENYGSFENHTQTVKSPIKMQEAPEPTAPVTRFEDTPLADGAHNNSHSLEQATLIEELTTAITETAVAEEDLTLMLIHAADISHNQQIIHLLRGTLDRIHKIFIFNQDTLGIIIFYAPLDQAMQTASSLYDEIHMRLAYPIKKTLGIGLTTRAGRLIPAPRMIEEASAAIGKATEEGSDPIVAFRVNPDKYRRCLARLS